MAVEQRPKTKWNFDHSTDVFLSRITGPVEAMIGNYLNHEGVVIKNVACELFEVSLKVFVHRKQSNCESNGPSQAPTQAPTTYEGLQGRLDSIRKRMEENKSQSRR